MITVNKREDFLKELKQFLPPSPVCAELGVLHGDLSKMILDIIEPIHLMLIDPFEVGGGKYESGLTTAYSTEENLESVYKRFYPEILTGVIDIYKEYSYQTATRVHDNILDLVYHDASHLYPDVKRDLNDWLPKLTTDACMCLHDYADIADFGVIKATDEFCKEHNFEKIIFNTNGGDIALKRK